MTETNHPAEAENLTQETSPQPPSSSSPSSSAATSSDSATASSSTSLQETQEQEQEQKEQEQKEQEQKEQEQKEQEQKEQKEQEQKEQKDYASTLVLAQERKQAGNQLFGSGSYSGAITEYTAALELMEGGHSLYPAECSVFFGNRAACYVSLGHHDSVIKDCSSALALAPEYTKALLRRAVAYEATNQLSKALTDFEALNKIDPTLKVAIEAKERLPPLVKIQQEKEAAEMISKLKDLGNSILGKFGLSTDNFQFTKDPATGGYSMNMKK